MKKLISIATVLSVMVFMTYVLAQVAGQPQPSPTRQTAPVKPAPSKKVVASILIGEVVSVDITADTITVKDKTDKSETLGLAPKVVVKKAGKIITLADVVAGDKVSVSYKTEADKKIATTISVKVMKKSTLPSKKQVAGPPGK